MPDERAHAASRLHQEGALRVAKHPAKCPTCGGRVDYDSAVGDRITCAQCGAVLAVPGKPDADSKSPTLTGQPTPADTDPLIGQSLGEFEILELLGRGGMGAVYKARQASLDRLVALKVLPAQLATDASFVERFSREARAAAAVRHPNIIEIHAVGEHQGHQYIAMELIEGETLGDLLKRDDRLPPDRALDLLRQTASALAEAHECGILHRDIKPSNVLLDRKGRAKVADFGLAKRPDSDVSVTVTGAALGTPLYMPPEAARGTFDTRSDLYSLGATFYHALAGRPPFLGASGAELLAKHLEDKAPPLAQLAPDVPAPFCRIIHRLLRKRPADRYPSADKLLEALARVGVHPASAASARGPRPPSTDRRPPRSVAPTATLPPDGRPRPKTTRRRGPVGGTSPSRVLTRGRLLAVGIAAALVLAVVLVLGRGRRSAVSPPPSPKPGTRNLEPGRDAAVAERNASIVLRNIQTCIRKKDYAKAQTWLNKLRSEYGKTKFAAAHRADIAALRTQIDAYVKGTAKPPPPKPGIQHPAPTPPPQPPKPEPPPRRRPGYGGQADDDERWTEWEDLFDGKSLDGWRVSPEQHAERRNAHVEDGAIILQIGQPRTAITWTGAFPDVGYEVAAQGMNLAGARATFAFSLPVGGGLGQVGLTTTREGAVAMAIGLGEIKVRGGYKQRAARVEFERGRWYELRVRVTKAGLEGWIDNEKLLDLPAATLTVIPVAEDLRTPFSLRTWETKAAIRSIRLRRLRPEPPDDERWTEWEDLFDGKTLDGWRVWRQGEEEADEPGPEVTNGAFELKGKATRGVVSTRPLPRVDYEIEMETTNVSGHRGLPFITLPVGDTQCLIGFHPEQDRCKLTISQVDKERRSFPVGIPATEFRPQRWFHWRIRVARGRLAIWVDRRAAVDLDLAEHAIQPFYAYPSIKNLAFHTYWAMGLVRHIRLRRLRPEAKAGPWQVYTRWPFDAAEAKRRQAEAAKALGVPVEQDIEIAKGVKMTMVLVPAGEFMMGNPFAAERCVRELGGTVARYNKQKPEHRVRLTRPFWLGKGEVTQQQWQAVMGTNPSAVKAPRHPVDGVSWLDCQAFVKRLNERVPGGGFRLPTEAEWEAACRAGSSGFYCFGNDPRELPAYGWHKANAERKPHPVMTRKPNAWGLHDLHGNVAEWCADCYGRYPADMQTDPRGPGTGTQRVLRNGDWPGDASLCISAHRHGLAADARGPSRGFRIARSVRRPRM